MTVGDLVAAMERIAPAKLAEPWDNVGLLVGDPQAALSRALLCIDLTPAVLDEAIAAGAQAVVAYHPVIFDGIKRLGPRDVAFQAATKGIAIYCPHTALDAAAGGTNDVLANAFGLTDVGPLRASEGRATTCKLVTFVPREAEDRVAEALFAAGAGRIGEYAKCSFRTEGTGTFQGSDASNPAVGEAGKFERTPEIKIESIVPLTKVGAVVKALRESHPYEEPAFDLTVLAAIPEAGGVGVGRVGTARATLGELLERTRRLVVDSMGASEGGGSQGKAVGGGSGGGGGLLVSSPFSDDTVVERVAVCAGAGRSLIGDVLRSGATVYVTGELPHHDALALRRAGVAAICTLHSNSERGVLPSLAAKLQAEAKGLQVAISQRDSDPFRIV